MNKGILVPVLILLVISMFVMIPLFNSIAIRTGAEGPASMIKHLLYTGLSITCILTFSSLNYRRAINICLIMFAGAFVSTYLVSVMGTRINGVKRWINLGFFFFQPSEFVKTLCLLPSAYLLAHSKHIYNFILLGLCCLGILSQPDLGMTFLTLAGMGAQVFYVGEYLTYYASLAGGIFVLGGLALLTIAKYAQNRLTIFFGKEEGYQIKCSLNALAHSVFFGNDTVVYIPDSHCDFVFSAIANGLGIVIALLTIILPCIISWNVIKDIDHLPKHIKIFLVGFGSQYAIQSYFHILSNLGLVPTKGVILPFISVGGTSMIIHGVAIGLVLSIKKYYASYRDKKIEF